MEPLTALGVATTSFVGFHFLLSAHPLREKLVGAMGAGGFMGFYSLVSLGTFGWMLWAWRDAPMELLWAAPAWTRWITAVGTLIAFLFLVIGVSTPNPTGMMQSGQLEKGADAVRGITRVTRHPALWGFALWGLAHLPSNGDVRSAWVMGGMVVLAIGGMVHIDRRRRRAHPDGWATFAKHTSLVPFAAIARGDQKLVLAEIGFVRLLAALGVFAAMGLIHHWAIGVSPWP